MKKKYIYNGQLMELSDIQDAAKQSNIDVNAYIQKAGIKEVNDSYSYNGKVFSAQDVLDAANESKLGFDDYIQKAGFQSGEKKNLSSNGGGIEQKVTTTKYVPSTSPSESLVSNPTDAFSPFPKTPTVTTNDGTTFPVTEVVTNNLVETKTTPEALQALQNRIISKTPTQDDIAVLAKSSGKSTEAVTAYISGGQLMGGSVENVENVNNTKTKLVNYINDYNTIYGTKYEPDDILSTSQKTHDFLETAKNKKAVEETQFDPTKQVASSTRVPQTTAAIPALIPLDISDEMINNVVSKKIDENARNGVSKDQTIVEIAKLTNPKAFERSQKALTPDTPKISDVNITSAIGNLFRDNTQQEELFNYQKGVAELSYNRVLKQNSINKISEGVLNNNQELVTEGQHGLSQVDENVMDKYPALQKQEMVRRVNETIAREAGSIEGNDISNVKEFITGASNGDRERVMRELGYFDNPKTKDLANQLLDQSYLFADASLLGSMATSFLEPFKGIGLFIGDVTGARTAKDRLAETISDQIYPKELPNDPNNPLKGIVQHTRTIANTTANLAGMMVVATLTEGFGGEIGLPENTAKRLGSYTSFGLPSFDASLKDAPNFIESVPAQFIYAGITAIANAEGGRLLDLGKVTRIPGVSEDFAKLAQGVTDKTMSEEAAKELLDGAKNKYIEFAVKFTPKYAGNVAKGAATMSYFNITNNVIKYAFGDPNVEQTDILPQAGHAFLDGVLGMSILGGFGAAADMRNEKNTTYKGVIYNMALNHDAAKDIFDLGLKNREYDQAAYDNKVAILNTAVSAKQFLDKAESESNVTLTTTQKSVYVANRTAENTLREKARDAVLPENKTKYTEQADRLKEQSDKILTGLKFTTNLEPLQNLYDAQKEYDTALENYNPDIPETVKALDEAKSKFDAQNVRANNDLPDTRLTAKIQGLDEQGVPINEPTKVENGIAIQPPQSFPEPITVGGETKTVPPNPDLSISENKVETDKALMEGKLSDKALINDIEVPLPEKGFIISDVTLKEGNKKGEGSGQEVYKKALDEHGVLYSFHPVSEDALRVQDKLVEKGIATIENVTLSDGTEVRKITKPITKDVAIPISEEIKSLSKERDTKIKEISKPEVKLDFVEEKDLPHIETDATYKGEVIGKKKIANPELVTRQNNIRDRFNKLKDLIDCLTV